MYSKQIKIQNKTGLHARPASEFVSQAGKFKSKIELQRVGEEDKYNAKSIIMLMSLGLAQGERAILSAEGEDEKEAVDALAELVAGTKEGLHCRLSQVDMPVGDPHGDKSPARVLPGGEQGVLGDLPLNLFPGHRQPSLSQQLDCWSGPAQPYRSFI